MELKIYICGKVTGEDEVACTLKFLAAEVRLKNIGVHTVINPKNMGIPHTWPWKESMETCMKVLEEKANAILLLSDWEDSPGARREKKYAEEHDYLIVKEDELNGILLLIRQQSKYKWMDTSRLEKPGRTWVDTSHLEFP